MLQSLHVKNLALMEETEVEFGEGLNILTGETGAGKSLVIGSIGLALGAKFDKDMLRTGAESALVELTFTKDELISDKLREMDIDDSEDTVLLSRKLQTNKSVCRINGETVTARQMKELAEYLIDIHGQHEHQSLLHKKKHMEILDSFGGKKAEELLAKCALAYNETRQLRKQIEEESLDEEAKLREQSLAEFEYQEIENAKLTIGEDEELENRYRFMSNSKKITENLSESYGYTGSDSSEGAGNSISRALRAIRQVSGYDSKLQDLEEQLTEIDNLLSDYNRELSAYMDDCEFDEEDFTTVEDRLNTINHLKGKYGKTIEDVLAYKDKKEQQLQKLSDYDAYMAKLEQELQAKEKALKLVAEELSSLRVSNAAVLQAKLLEALVQLNFLSVEFEIAVRPTDTISAKGLDDVEFLISTNPGENVKPLGQVASGGELSRVMLAIKTVLAGSDNIDTLIFDEIDAGISGKTAWKVSEQLNVVAGEHQVICITHLPQIAAMADRHFCIQKSSNGDNTITDVTVLDEEESLAELARLLGSDALSEAALANAREMRSQAMEVKGK